MLSILQTSSLITVENTLSDELLSSSVYPWDVLPQIKDYIRALSAKLPREEYHELFPDVWVHQSAKIAVSASLSGPTIIGPNTEVRHCAFIRGAVLIDADCVIGNSCEFKNSVLLPHVQVPHFNYCGDSILGQYSHMGAGSITSNVKGDRSTIHVKYNNELIETGLRKFGAILGDHVEIGCNSVLNPGTVIGKNTRVYPLSSVRGFVPGQSIYKTGDQIVPCK